MNEGAVEVCWVTEEEAEGNRRDRALGNAWYILGTQ